MAHIEERVEQVAAAKFITVLDLSKGYWQIRLTKSTKRYAAFVTSFGSYRCLTMPFGLVAAPFWFQSCISNLLKGCEELCVPYLDDMAIYSETWEDHLKHIV